MRLVLAIDTSTPAVTAGLVALPDGAAPQLPDAAPQLPDGAAPRLPDGAAPRSLDAAAPRLLDERVTVDARAHAELLAPQLRDLLAGHAVDALVCGTGPGPFTGLRVGMVTAAALGDGLGLPVYGVCSLDAIAAAVQDPVDGLLVATDARRREVYWAAYRRGAAGPRRVQGPHVWRPADLARELPSLGVTAAAGAGAALYAGVLGLPLLDPPYPTAVGLVAVAADELRRGAEPAPLVPLYLRRPDAVANAAPRKAVLQR